MIIQFKMFIILIAFFGLTECKIGDRCGMLAEKYECDKGEKWFVLIHYFNNIFLINELF